MYNPHVSIFHISPHPPSPSSPLPPLPPNPHVPRDAQIHHLQALIIHNQLAQLRPPPPIPTPRPLPPQTKIQPLLVLTRAHGRPRRPRRQRRRLRARLPARPPRPRQRPPGHPAAALERRRGRRGDVEELARGQVVAQLADERGLLCVGGGGGGGGRGVATPQAAAAGAGAELAAPVPGG